MNADRIDETIEEKRIRNPVGGAPLRANKNRFVRPCPQWARQRPGRANDAVHINLDVGVPVVGVNEMVPLIGDGNIAGGYPTDVPGTAPVADGSEAQVRTIVERKIGPVGIAAAMGP